MFTPVISQNGLRNSFNQQAYREAIISLLTRRRMPFSAVEWSEMKDLALACNPAVEDLLITSRRTAVRLIASNYELYKGQIKEGLATSASPIHISSDLWTSPHRHSLLAVCAQWVDAEGRLQKALLGLPECRYSHSGEKQASLILQVIEEFDIQSNLGWHTSDNATSNNTCLEVMQSRLLTEHQIQFNARQRRIRCIGHIIHLSLQAFLLASSREALLAALESAADVSGEELIVRFSDILESQKQKQRTDCTLSKERYRSKSGHEHAYCPDGRDSLESGNNEFSGIQGLTPLRKLHELAVWLRSSSLHADIWDDSVGLRLGIDNRTRWSSWFLVIDRAIIKQAEIKAFMTDHEAVLGNNRLNAQDWDFLDKARTFLQPFASATLYAEGEKSSISQSLPLMDALLAHYERNKVHYSQEDHRDLRMVRAIEMGWFVLNKYYNLTDETPVYAAALLLDPSRRAAYIRKNWPTSWVEPAIAAAKELWESTFSVTRVESDAITPSLSPPLEMTSRQRWAELDLLMKDMEVITADTRDDDDFGAFIEQPTFRIDCSPLDWWSRSEQKSRYPRLHAMAITLLSIPAESSEPERAFSGSRRTCSWDRLSLSCHNIQRIECIGSWIREGHIKPSKLSGMGLPMEASVMDEDDDIDGQILDAIEWV
ncbi:putative AC9 transposase [Beauveria bassiana]|nr:putative AC9 transposase [Beauveria bassiana]KAF1730631.1 putative AC9 transposase [Beauveria bassiana]KAH8715347.1 putative AC9 transposase [Beauveria bassiana]KAH8715348.1 putative AC9 transposase [Beauveria bassiana]